MVPSWLSLPKHFHNWIYSNNKICFFFLMCVKFLFIYNIMSFDLFSHATFSGTFHSFFDFCFWSFFFICVAVNNFFYLTDMSHVFPFYVEYPVSIYFISFPYNHKTFETYSYAKKSMHWSMPWKALKMLIKISGNIFVSCIKISSQGYIKFLKDIGLF